MEKCFQGRFRCICQDEPIRKAAVTLKAQHIVEWKCQAHSIQLVSRVTVYLFTRANCNSVHGAPLQ